MTVAPIKRSMPGGRLLPSRCRAPGCLIEEENRGILEERAGNHRCAALPGRPLHDPIADNRGNDLQADFDEVTAVWPRRCLSCNVRIGGVLADRSGCSPARAVKKGRMSCGRRRWRTASSRGSPVQCPDPKQNAPPCHIVETRQATRRGSTLHSPMTTRPAPLAGLVRRTEVAKRKSSRRITKSMFANADG